MISAGPVDQDVDGAQVAFDPLGDLLEAFRLQDVAGVPTSFSASFDDFLCDFVAASSRRSRTATAAPHSPKASAIQPHRTPPPPVIAAVLPVKSTFNGTVMFQSILEATAVRPQAECRVGDVEYLLAVGQRIEAVLQLIGVIFATHLGQVGVLEVDALDFFARQVAGAVGDRETALRGTVNQVGRGAEVLPQIFVRLNRCMTAGVPT